MKKLTTAHLLAAALLALAGTAATPAPQYASGIGTAASITYSSGVGDAASTTEPSR